MIRSLHLQVSVIDSRDPFMRRDDGSLRNPKRMLDAKDIQLLQGMFEAQEIRIQFQIHTVRDEIINRLNTEMHTVRDDIIDVNNNGVLPQIEKLDHRVTRLERWARIA